HVTRSGMMLGRECNDDVCVLRSNRSRIAVREIDTAIRQADVVDDSRKFLGRDLLAKFAFHVVAQGSGFFNACSGRGSQVECELTAINRREKILSQPWQQTERNKAGHEKSGDKNA